MLDLLKTFPRQNTVLTRCAPTYNEEVLPSVSEVASFLLVALFDISVSFRSSYLYWVGLEGRGFPVAVRELLSGLLAGLLGITW